MKELGDLENPLSEYDANNKDNEGRVDVSCCQGRLKCIQDWTELWESKQKLIDVDHVQDSYRLLGVFELQSLRRGSLVVT